MRVAVLALLVVLGIAAGFAAGRATAPDHHRSSGSTSLLDKYGIGPDAQCALAKKYALDPPDC